MWKLESEGFEDKPLNYRRYQNTGRESIALIQIVNTRFSSKQFNTNCEPWALIESRDSKVSQLQQILTPKTLLFIKNHQKLDF